MIENTLLELGNIENTAISEVAELYATNYIMNTIHTEDFSIFIEICRNNNIEYPVQLSSPCELCEFLFHDDIFLEGFERTEFFYGNFRILDENFIFANNDSGCIVEYQDGFYKLDGHEFEEIFDVKNKYA